MNKLVTISVEKLEIFAAIVFVLMPKAGEKRIEMTKMIDKKFMSFDE